MEPTIIFCVTEVYVECNVCLVYISEVEIDGVVHVSSEGDVIHRPDVLAVTGMNRLPPAEAAGGQSRLGWQVHRHHSAEVINHKLYQIW